MEQRSSQRLTEAFESEEFGDRTCRVIVVEHLYPIFALNNLELFKKAFRQVVLAHHFLYNSEARILHRDISLHNLMYRRGANDTVQGVLIDFDLASVGEPTSESHHGRRTGTRRFMAAELFVKGQETPVHLERFDWESFFYVLCWIGTHYSGGVEIKTDVFNEWDLDNDGVIGTIKSAALSGNCQPQFTRLFTDFYMPVLFSWVMPMQDMYNTANKAKNDFAKFEKLLPGDKTQNLDTETVGGIITWEKFWEILSKEE